MTSHSGKYHLLNYQVQIALVSHPLPCYPKQNGDSDLHSKKLAKWNKDGPEL